MVSEVLSVVVARVLYPLVCQLVLPLLSKCGVSLKREKREHSMVVAGAGVEYNAI